MYKVFEVLNAIIDIIYPENEKCVLCSSTLTNVNEFQICSHCRAVLDFLPFNTCVKCGKNLENSDKGQKCKMCMDIDPCFDDLASVFIFSGIVQDALHRLKYDGEIEIAIPMGKFMARELKQRKWDIDMIIPVPLYDARLAERGFNQSELLSDEIGREVGIDSIHDILIRKKHTEPQASLSRVQRLNNVKDAFEVMNSKILKGKTVLLIDDITTTGATLNECSKVLKENGAGNVYCLAAASPVYYI